MENSLSPDARRIIEDAMRFAKAENPQNAAVAANNAVRMAIGNIGMVHLQGRYVDILDPLIEIAQLHIREKLSTT